MLPTVHKRYRIHRKFVAAAELEDACWEDGGVYHFITRNSHERVGHRDEDGKWSIDKDTLSWEQPTFTDRADTEFSHGDLMELVVRMFEKVTKVFICQEQPGVWIMCDAADFMDLAEPGVWCLSQMHDQARQNLISSERVRAALQVKLCMPDDDCDFQRCYPVVAESEDESDVSVRDAESKVSVEFRTGKGKLEGHFYGSGEQRG
jgi:hypothetical protein